MKTKQKTLGKKKGTLTGPCVINSQKNLHETEGGQVSRFGGGDRVDKGEGEIREKGERGT